MLKGHLRLSICAAAVIMLGCSESSDVTATNTETPGQTAALDAKPGPDGWAGAVRGTVTDLNGGAVEGAYVKLRNEARRLTVMVVSKDGGSFVAGNLPSGQWTVQAVGGDVESQWSQPVNVSLMGTVEANVA